MLRVVPESNTSDAAKVNGLPDAGVTEKIVPVVLRNTVALKSMLTTGILIETSDAL